MSMIVAAVLWLASQEGDLCLQYKPQFESYIFGKKGDISKIFELRVGGLSMILITGLLWFV
jgi:hypothetical protein